MATIGVNPAGIQPPEVRVNESKPLFIREHMGSTSRAEFTHSRYGHVGDRQVFPFSVREMNGVNEVRRTAAVKNHLLKGVEQGEKLTTYQHDFAKYQRGLQEALPGRVSKWMPSEDKHSAGRSYGGDRTRSSSLPTHGQSSSGQRVSERLRELREKGAPLRMTNPTWGEATQWSPKNFPQHVLGMSQKVISLRQSTKHPMA